MVVTADRRSSSLPGAMTGARPAIAIGAISAAAIFLPTWAAAGCVLALLLAPVAWYAFAEPQRWLPLLFFALLLLPPIPLPFGDTGPHPAILVAALGLLAGMVRLDQWTSIHWSLPSLALLALTFALAISIAFAAVYSGPAIAASSAARLALFGIGVYVYFSAAHGPDRQRRTAAMHTTRTLFWIAAGAALFGCIDFLYQLPAPAGFEPKFLWLDSGVYRRAQGFFYESSTLGNFCAFFLVFVSVSLAEPRTRRVLPGMALGLGAVLFASAMLLSFSRASVLACGVSLMALAVIERDRWFTRRSWMWIAGLGCVAVILFAIAVPEVAEGYWGRLQQALDNIQDSPDRTFSGRLASWTTVAGFIGEHPWQTIFGIGYKTLPYTEYLGRPVIADNMYLSLLVETGVLGFIALIALNVAILGASWKALRRGSFHGKWLFCFWIGESLQMLSGDILTYWRVLPIYFWVLAQAVHAGERTGEGEPRATPIG
ncbi:MAG: O-antigen ligase family protein [Acidobacteriota bacterium]